MVKTESLIIYSKFLNIQFNYIDEAEANNYLKNDNNYFNVAYYMDNFPKYPSPAGIYEGKYINLDFAYLIDLYDIDKKLRLILFEMLMALEHSLKMKILSLEREYEYKKIDIVNGYLEKDFNEDGRLHKDILSKVGKAKYNTILSKYDIDKDKRIENMPIWELLEIITFGQLVRFYEYMCNTYKLKNTKEEIYIFKDIVRLRNSVCHNENILANIAGKDIYNNPDFAIVDFLDKCGIGKEKRNRKLSNSRIRQITYTIVTYMNMIKDKEEKIEVITRLKNLMDNRIIRHKEYYTNNEVLTSTYIYFKKIIDKIYEMLS